MKCRFWFSGLGWDPRFAFLISSWELPMLWRPASNHNSWSTSPGDLLKMQMLVPHPGASGCNSLPESLEVFAFNNFPSLFWCSLSLSTYALACVCLHILPFGNPGGEPVTHQMSGVGKGLEIMQPNLTLLLIRKLNAQRANSSVKCPSPVGSTADVGMEDCPTLNFPRTPQAFLRHCFSVCAALWDRNCVSLVFCCSPKA